MNGTFSLFESDCALSTSQRMHIMILEGFSQRFQVVTKIFTLRFDPNLCKLNRIIALFGFSKV